MRKSLGEEKPEKTGGFVRKFVNMGSENNLLYTPLSSVSYSQVSFADLCLNMLCKILYM